MEAVVAAKPDVFNHNLETVPRLYPGIAPVLATITRCGCSTGRRRSTLSCSRSRASWLAWVSSASRFRR